MATVLTSGKGPLDFVLSEANGKRSRDNVVIPAGNGILQPGTVLAASGANHVPLTAAAGAGAVAILGYRVDTTGAGAVRAAAITRDAEVNRHQLVWPAGITAPEQTAAINALAAKGIMVR
jgi:hypothetical protein